MKKLILIAAFVLAGCSAMATYDPVEYNHLNDLVTISELSAPKCATTAGQKEIVDALSLKMAYINNYARHLSANYYLTTTMREIDTIISEFALRVATKPASEAYCKTKLHIIAIVAGDVQYTLGNAR